MYQRRTELPATNRNDWRTIQTLLPYLWEHGGRIGIALAFLALAKLANIGVPLALKQIVDALDTPLGGTSQALSVPIFLLIGYGVLRLGTSLFNELRNAVFAKASQRAIRRIALKVFHHLHGLALRFHLDRQTGGLSRDIERGSRSISQLLQYLIFSVLPTIFEIGVVSLILFANYSPWFAIVTLVTVALYFVYTYKITNWRTKYRVRMNQMDSKANTRAIDSLLNYETVKYFGNEDYETEQYDRHLQGWEKASIKSQTSLALLNIGQGIIISVGLTLIMIMAGRGVASGSMTMGDFVLVNAFLIQLYIPLNFLGTIFREIKHCLTDMEQMFGLLEVPAEISDKPGARDISIADASIRFENVEFAYNPDRPILHGVSFTVPAGNKVAVVGSSGAGKSTLARLLFRFYDVSAGRITIDGQDIREVTAASLRAAIGIVPQDTVLFNDTIGHNIEYGRPSASRKDMERAARLAQLDEFIHSLPKGYDTEVGERGLKLSGGEKQRVAIARTLLKDPPILILDEATSALDSKSEKAIQSALEAVATNRTTLVIAHRLSTVIDADQILVLDQGRIVESGDHRQLLHQAGLYADMWALQQEQEEADVASFSDARSVQGVTL
ncbi:MAG: ABC transporter ATP-binding protein/permease [Gammaproteobacteria bacterium]|nr:ABC transporter ATP-binding protein/permease [Gammaproteobacteria bacterium]